MKKLLLLLIAAIFFVACDPNNPESDVQTCTMDRMTFSYYLSDRDGNIKNTFTKEDWLLVHLDVTNHREETMMVDRNFMGGSCYDKKGEWMEYLSSYVTANDSFPNFKPIAQGNTYGLVYTFLLKSSPSGSYRYKNPQIRYCIREEIVSVDNCPSDVQEITLPLTINFKVQ